MKYLVVVESPTKARTISKFLGDDYVIKASMGHVMDLPKSKLGINIDNNFTPEYELLVDKKKIVSELKSLAKEADSIILATDPDREGEAIASQIAELLQPKKALKRIVFHEITSEAISEALANPRTINEDLVNAQTARRVLDRIVGYKLSPLLWKKVRRGLSAGRVQSVALRFIVEREKEIEKFSKQKYWTITAQLVKEDSKKSQPTAFELTEINNEKIQNQESLVLYDGDYKYSDTIIKSEEKAKEIISDIDKKHFEVEDVVKKETKRSPQPPYTTSTLQQEASRRFGFSGKRTMTIAQKLYEEGVITYHRTDSVVLASTAISAMRKFIESSFGSSYIPDKPREYSGKQKLAQEAHEAIRPTQITKSTEQIESELGKDLARLYDLIFRRAVASQMSDAIIESTSVTVLVKGSKDAYTFKANGSVLVFEGFLKMNPLALQDNRLADFDSKETLLAKEILPVEHETTPPPRYNDASLIGILEEKGIGRPSTYASIISTIEGRRYIERVERRFIPTTVGIAVNEFLVKNFAEIDDIPFTAEMEDKLDDIAQGKKQWVEMMSTFYKPLEKQLVKVEDAKRVQIPVEKTNEICPQCGAELVIREGRFGRFLSCSKFPECKFTKPIIEETNLVCPKDNAKIIIKKTKKGRRFYGCSNYPNCTFAAWKLEDIKAAS